jgi:hypothetical protein
MRYKISIINEVTNERVTSREFSSNRAFESKQVKNCLFDYDQILEDSEYVKIERIK